MNRTQQVLNDHQASRRRHLFGFGAVIALAFLLVAIALNAARADLDRKHAEGLHLHTLHVLLANEQIHSAVEAALRDERGYLITGDPSYRDDYRRSAEAAPRLASELADLTRDNPTQRANVAALRAGLQRYFAVLDRKVELNRRGATDEAVEIVKSGVGRREAEAVLAVVTRIEREERRLLADREVANAHATHAERIADYVMTALALLFLGIVAWAGITASRARMKTLQMEEALRRAATTDELTGLPNRRAFLHMLDVELARSNRSGAPLALALIDLDHFKSINDRFGHAGGDETLRRFAQVARETIRTADVIGRIGGEEFAVLMPDTDQIQSGIAGERLREAIERRRLILPSGALVPLTISVGVAHHLADEDRDRLIVRADEALYEAKESGRNRTRLAA